MPLPPSLPPGILSRSFRASNGEIGLLPCDAGAFLDACEADGLSVLGWEAWLADHEVDAASNAPRRRPGAWCGLIPVRDSGHLHVLHGSGDLAEVRRQIADLDFGATVDAPWLQHLRLNFTLDD